MFLYLFYLQIHLAGPEAMKIFLPSSVFESKESCDLYGDIVQISENKTKSYYVIKAVHSKFEEGGFSNRNFRCIGHIAKINNNAKITKSEDSLFFRYDESTPHIFLDKDTTTPMNANIFLYEPAQLMQMAEPVEEPWDDISVLRRLLHDFLFKDKKSAKQFSIKLVIATLLNLPLQLMARLFICSMESWLVMKLLNKTSFYEHYREWRLFNCSGKRNWNITLDKILGLLVMLMLLFYIQDPSDYVIKILHLVIEKLRLLLRSLKGSPIGLKLNVHLNNFFLDCFSYHIDLWATFLNIIEPTVQKLFVPITLLGSMGLSCQLALFADLISIVGLHAHCFYIYAAALYKVETRGLSVLWKVVRGKRFNLLKKRVESHNYTNRQLYLATIFFTTLLFLFPTILVYYVVFTTLRLCTNSATCLLKILRRRILEFPIQDLYEWWNDNYRDRDSIRIEFFSHMPVIPTTESPKNRIFVFKINVQSSSLGRIFSSESGVLQELTNKDLTLKEICKRILEGNF